MRKEYENHTRNPAMPTSNYNLLLFHTIHQRDILNISLTLAEWLSARPSPVGEADPLCRAVQRVSHCAGEAHLAPHFEVACLPAGMGRCAGIPTSVGRVTCNGR